MGYIDFSGSGVVHCTGAFGALAGTIIVGPRYNKFKKFEDVADMRTPEERAKPLLIHNIQLFKVLLHLIQKLMFMMKKFNMKTKELHTREYIIID